MAVKMALAITCAMLLASCGPDIDLSPEAGWTGSRPATDREFAMAALAEQRGRERANAKLELARKKYQRGY